MIAIPDVNFIHHFLNVYQAFYKDNRLRPTHLCLYTALFIYWNKARWENPFEIFRSKIMKMAKIGSLNTYYRCMNELNTWGYINYFPSSSQSVPSMVVLHRYDKVVSLDAGIKSDSGPDKSAIKSDSPGTIPPVPEVGLYINTLNAVNGISAVSAENYTGQGDAENPTTLPAARKKKAGHGKPESLEEAAAFFLSINSTEREAARFFHHYEGVGWVKGNTLPIKNWHSVAHAWLNDPRSRQAHASGPTPGSLQTPGTPGIKKNFDIKL